ncbi:transcriptional regulator, DeoR family [Andreprevotia lacus DSM 23236]|jgi:DeoR/GlpR family transcriptional regulator of sugar metabolism|uniref:Transcriptional regulator, DeoR family n=2 Tax=Andreprevotia TaxID=397275 RepID=A0A1W1X4M7_9NEIS|nr:transcriptional regulator, DeoR family [Andreprevotia lacus DSM 23236]
MDNAPNLTPLADHRMQLIMTLLANKGECRVRELAEQFKLSEMTVRRDLQELEARGLLKRVHGGAVLISHDVGYPQRVQQGQAQKQRIGHTAASLLRNGMAIYLDAGTTAMEIARAIRSGLPDVRQLSIVTHGINIATELSGQTPYSLHLIGGEVYQNAFSTVGPAALEQIAGFHFDLFFMGAGGVDTLAGWTNSNHQEAQVKRAVMARSAETCAIVGSDKWGQRTFAPVARFEDVRSWIVDRELPADAMRIADQVGMSVIYAD